VRTDIIAPNRSDKSSVSWKRDDPSGDAPTSNIRSYEPAGGYAAASRAQPAADKLRAYQQHVSRLAADTQVDLTCVTEDHVKKTAETARVLADEVTRVAKEETEQGMRRQEETMRQFSAPFASASHGQRDDTDSTQQGSSPHPATMQ